MASHRYSFKLNAGATLTRAAAHDYRGEQPPRPLRSGATLLVTLGVDVKRPRFTIHDFRTDDDLLDAFKARQIEHCVEQDALHDRTQAARAGAPFDRLLGNDVQRLV